MGRRTTARTSAAARPPGFPAGQPAGQRGPDPDGQEGPLELAAAVRRQAVRLRTSQTRSWRRCCRRCTQACSQSGRAGQVRRGRVPTWRRSCSPGIPSGIVPGFQNNTGTGARGHAPAQHRRSRPPASRTRWASSAVTWPGIPNGRRVFDDVVTIELRAIAGATYPLVRQELHTRRSRRRDHRRADPCQRPLRLPQPVPLPRRALQRLRHAVLTSEPSRALTAAITQRPAPGMARSAPAASRAGARKN